MSGTKKLSTSTKAMFELLSDGRVHPIANVLNAGVTAGLSEDYKKCLTEGAKKTTKNQTIIDAAKCGAEKIAQRNLNNAVQRKLVEKTPTGVRMKKAIIKNWVQDDDNYVQYFEPQEAESGQEWGRVAEYGNMTEWEGWSYAPLRTRDLVHVRLMQPVPLDILKTEFLGWEVIESPEGLVTISGNPGDPIKKAVIEWLEIKGYPHEGVREAKGIKRRNLNELPPDFLRALMERTIPLAYNTVAKKYRASMEVLTGSREDTKGWVSLWVVEFATMFDASKGRPFAAWAQIQIKHKIQDLNRSINGRTASDLEIRWSRARESLESELGRQATVEEISKTLNLTTEEGVTKRSLIGQLKAIRSAGPIDLGPDSADLPLVDHLADPEIETLRREARQRVTMAIIASAGTLDKNTGERTLELPLGFLATYLMEWDDWVKSDLIALSGCASSKITKEINLIRDSLKTQLQDLAKTF